MWMKYIEGTVSLLYAVYNEYKSRKWMKIAKFAVRKLIKCIVAGTHFSF